MSELLGESNQSTLQYPADVRHTAPNELRACQLVMLRMLRIFDQICRAHDIPYFLVCGTLLGAFRHQGFIPWDADVDVGVPVEYSERLFKVLEAHVPPDIFVQSDKSDPTFNANDRTFIKLRDRYSNYTEWETGNPQYKWHNGLQVDIFFYEKVGDQHVNTFINDRLANDALFPFKEYEFEGTLFYGPCNAERCLVGRYGDLDLPPKEQQIAHEGRADPFHPCNHKESNLGDYPIIVEWN